MKLRLLPLPLLLASGIAHADWLTGNLGLASDYQFRGLDQTNGLAVQGGLDYVHDSGLYAGGWATRNRSAGGGEFDLYGGYTRPLHLFGLLNATLDAGLAGYVYTGERPAVLGAGSQDFAE
ncbi:MAG TPA: TorF family putative porin, partial [Nevskia sp.]|nr:TorF family putative porin [Nevskia sp.]